jgi:conjugative relaxase-like TrwC/TraI family protein
MTGLGVTGEVSADQMRALFGEGRHPDATVLETAAIAAGASPEAAMRSTRLGRPFPVYGEAERAAQFRARVAASVREWNQQAGNPHSGKVDDDTYARIRTRAARDVFAEHFHRPPADGRELDGFIKRCSRPERTATAGFDLTFSPVKSVSVLWAVAPRVISEQIEAAHDAAVAQTVCWLEGNAVFTREGTDGVRQVDVRGLVAAAFTHRDSRAGDPDLHTHVPIANKVQTLEGRWLALDGQAIYKANVAASEHYNTALETELRHRLGVRFADAPERADKRVIREIEGVDAALSARWSSRAGMIEARRSQLARHFLQDHGRPPTPVEQYALGQQANLETRAAKHEARSLADQRAQWRDEAIGVLGQAGLSAMLAEVSAAPSLHGAGPELTDRLLGDIAGAALAKVSESRSVWQATHVRAEAERRVRVLELAPEAVEAAVQAVTEHVLWAGSVPLSDPDAIAVPDGLRRRDGQSVYVRHGSQLFTSPAVLAAEAAVMTAAGHGGGFAIAAGEVDLALLESTANGLDLNAAQAGLVRAMATSGACCQLALAPAGTGKTSAMRVLASALRTAGAQVLGLAPSAVAVGELAAALGTSADTIDLLKYHLSGLAPYAGELDLSDAAEGRRPEWMRAIGPRSVVIVDEAGMASTTNLHAVLDYVTAKGGSVRLVGDDRQLASVAAGGLLRDIKAAHGALDLRDPVRFTDPAEGQATLAVREGDDSGLAYALDNGRVHVGDPGTVADAVYGAWSADAAAGADSLMLAPSRALVAALNTRARADRLAAAAAAAAAGTSPGHAVDVLDGCQAGRGDTVITRRNDRRLTLGQTDFVANGDRWTVLEAHRGGRLTVRHQLTGRIVGLPAEYVAAHVQLGYATTVHGAQGLTVGSRTTRGTVHAAIDPGMSREQLYVAMTRATDANHLHVIVVGDGGEHSIIRPETISPSTGGEILGRILAREGARTSAATAGAALADPRCRLQRAAAKYAEDLHAASATVLGADLLDRLAQDAEAAMAGITAWPAWPALRGRLALIAADGRDPIPELTAAAGSRDLRTAGDPAAVLDWRLERFAHQRKSAESACTVWGSPERGEPPRSRHAGLRRVPVDRLIPVPIEYFRQPAQPGGVLPT